MATVYNNIHCGLSVRIIGETNFVSTHLLHCVHILNGEGITINLLLKSILRCLQVDTSPLFHGRCTATGFGTVRGVRTPEKS